MAATTERARVAPAAISFELERFERADGRLVLSGRWFGVRGMRFVRPTLTLGFGDGTSARLLADLEHKPWAPLDGEQWHAAFPFDDDAAVLDAELDVAPGIAIPLPAPGEQLERPDLLAAVPRTPPAELQRRRGASPPDSARAAQRSAVPDELAALHAETQRLRQEPIRLQAELDRSEQLRKDVEDELGRLKLESDGAVARRDAAVGRFEDAVSERDEAVRTRDEAIQAHNEVAQARAEAVRDRDRAVARLRETVQERDAAVAARDAAVAERDRLAGERDAAAGERTAAVAERDRLRAELEQATAERDQARSQRPAPLATRPVPPTRAATPARPSTLPHVFSADQDQLIKRAVAIALLCVVGLALLIILGIL